MGITLHTKQYRTKETMAQQAIVSFVLVLKLVYLNRIITLSQFINMSRILMTDKYVHELIRQCF